MYSQVVGLRSNNNKNKKTRHVRIVGHNVLTSTKCVGGSRDKRSLIKTFATWTLPCAKGLFQHLYWIFFWNHFSPTAGSYATLPGFRAAKASILVVACWRMIGGFFHGCYLNQSSFSGQFTPEPLDNVWPLAHSWAMAQWNLKLSLAHNALRGL
jgi:hypothetical protein